MTFARTMRLFTLLTLPFMAAALTATTAQAQQAGAAATQVAADSLQAPPVSTLLLAPALTPALELPSTAGASDDLAAVQSRVRAGSNVALMGVGAAAVIVGLLIGGDSGVIIATGGAVVGLVGLYRFLR